MTRLIKIFLAILLPVAMLSSSCKKYLDVVPDDVATLESAFSNANETQAYLFGCYATLQNMANIRGNAGFTTSGEVIFPYPLQDPNLIGDAGFQILRGTQNSANPILNYWDGYNYGQNLWQAIRRCNTLIDNIDLPLDLSKYDKARFIAEAKFLKAYYHYWLIRMYGAIPIVDKNQAVNASTKDLQPKQQTVDSCFKYVVGLLDEVIPVLPAVIQNSVAEAGRITSTIALAVKAEALATQASPLFNGNPDYMSWKNIDGVNLFPAYDAGKWQKALDATKAAIDGATSAGAGLYSLKLTGNIVHLSDSTRQLLTIQGAFTDNWNSEQIWTLNPIFNYQYFAMPRVTAEAAANVFAVYSDFSVPLAESELFYTNHGVPINEDKGWDYPGRFQIQNGDSANYFYIHYKYPTVKGNFGREPRYYADVAFDGANWFGSGTTDDLHANYVNAVNGYASPPDQLRVNVTGYWAKKLVPYQSVPGQNSVWYPYSWPFMRLTGLWLMYAECLNEVNGPTSETYSWIDKVRARAGLQGVVSSWSNYSLNPSKPSTKEGLRQIIHQERRIELSFEGQAGWDLRRWKELQSVLSGPIQGWSVYSRTTTSYYTLLNVFQPVFGLRNYFYPIQDYDVLTNPNLVQTLYW